MNDEEKEYNYVLEQDAKRFKVLKTIYFETKGYKGNNVDTNDICKKTGICDEELFYILGYLKDQNLIKPLGSLYEMNNGSVDITITHQGVCEVEAAIKKPQQPTTYFPAMIENLSLNIENLAIDKSMSNIQNNDFNNANIGGGVAGRDYTGDVNHNYAAQQNLAEAAAEIQSILEQLEQTYPTATTSQQMIIAAEAINQIESNSKLKNRVIKAVKEGSLAALEKAIDNPLGAFVVSAFKSWQEQD